MGILTGINCAHFIEYDVQQENRDKMSYITGVKIINVRLNDLVEFLYEKLDPRNNLRDPVVKIAFDALPENTKKTIATSMFIYRYCIHRILTHFKLYSESVWQYFITDDYHSQEISAICLKDNVAQAVDQCLSQMVLLSDTKRIELMLDLEYGKIISSAYDKEWLITHVDVEDLHFSNSAHYERCMLDDMTYMKGYKLPRGLCILMPNGKYRVIDGYHRICAAIKNGDNILVIYCKAS